MQAKTLLPIVPFTLSLLFAPSAFAQNDTNQKSTPAGLVDALNGVFGKQTDNRAVQAKGIVLEGKFTPSPDAATLSKAPHLQDAAVPVTVRFSDFAGVPARHRS
jgi:catalase